MLELQDFKPHPRPAESEHAGSQAPPVITRTCSLRSTGLNTEDPRGICHVASPCSALCPFLPSLIDLLSQISACHTCFARQCFIFFPGPLFTPHIRRQSKGFRINTASFQLCSAHDFNTVPLDHPVLTRCEILAKADNLAARKFRSKFTGKSE